MPRKEYKTITVKVKTFKKFTRVIHEAKRGDPGLDNSTFLDLLLACKTTG